MSDKKYKLLKNFTPRDLYKAQAPIELFLTCMARRGDDINLKWLNHGPRLRLIGYEPWVSWLIDNGFIEEYEEDIELKPGMILENGSEGSQFIWIP